ncbi:MAG: AAA family ATPase [Candidatus Obscuribacter sp.]|nr:AAA family ATPase [Candidatus Obscuribacter sp.]
MLLKHVTVKNFRNYQDATLELSPSRNVLIGENAQGKTNLLEAIEIMANMRRTRGASDRELVMVGQSQAFIEVGYVSQGIAENASLTYALNPRLSKTIKINGVKQTRNELSGRISRLTAVSFSSRDLSLLRGGPKDRRDWLDDVMGKLRHSLYELLSKYEKVVQQRNRLLKTLFEKSASLSHRPGRTKSLGYAALPLW